MAVLKVIAITQQKKFTYGFLLRTKFLNPKLSSIPSCDIMSPSVLSCTSIEKC